MVSAVCIHTSSLGKCSSKGYFGFGGFIVWMCFRKERTDNWIQRKAFRETRKWTPTRDHFC
jgi:hypothetical protein